MRISVIDEVTFLIRVEMYKLTGVYKDRKQIRQHDAAKIAHTVR